MLLADPVETCRHVYAAGNNGDVSQIYQPCGFIRANHARTHCFLYLTTHNFLKLFQLLEPWRVTPATAQADRWRKALSQHGQESITICLIFVIGLLVLATPRYYYVPLKAALITFGLAPDRLGLYQLNEVDVTTTKAPAAPVPVVSVPCAAASPSLGPSQWNFEDQQRPTSIDISFRTHLLALLGLGEPPTSDFKTSPSLKAPHTHLRPSSYQLALSEAESRIHFVKASQMSDYSAAMKLQSQQYLRDPFADDGVGHYNQSPKRVQPSNSGKSGPRAVDEADQLTENSWPTSSGATSAAKVPSLNIS